MTNVLIQRMERTAPRKPKPSPAFTAARTERAIWLTWLEAREYRRKGDITEYNRLLDLAANLQREADERNGTC